MKYILISILIIILIVLISKNKEKFAIFYNKDDNDDKEKSYEVSVDLPNRLEYSLLTNDDINDLKKIESTVSDKKDYKIEQIQKHIEKSSETTLKDNIKLNLQNDADFMRSIKGNQGPRGESGISDINTDVIAKNLKINDKILDREHVNYIKDYHNGDLESLYGNQIDIRKDKKAIDQSLTNGLYTDTLNIGQLDNLGDSLAIRNELDAIQIDKLNANIMNINNNNIYSNSPNGINIDKLKVNNLNVQDGLKVDDKSIFEILKGSKGEKGDGGEISVLPDSVVIKDNILNLVYNEDNDITMGGKISQLTGLQGDKGPKGDIGDTGDPFDLPTNITTTDNVLTIEDKNNSFNVKGVKGDTGPQGYQGDRGDQGDHGLYPISVKQIGDELTFEFNDSNNNLTTSLPLDSYKGDRGVQGDKGDDGRNIYANSLNYDENNSIIEFTKNITFDDTNLKINKKNFDYRNLKDINSYMVNLARYLEIPIDYDIYVKSNAYNEIKTQLKTDLESKIKNLLRKDVNIYDFYFQEIEIEGNNYKIEKILDIAKILNIGINNKTQSYIVTQIKTLGQKFTDKTLFEKIIKDIEDNKEFIYIYKSFGNKLYFDPSNLSLEEMNKFFDNMGYSTLQDIKDNLKTISNIIYKVNIIEDNKFFYKMVNGKYKADDFKTKIDTLFNIFKLDGYYTLDEKLYILNNFKLGHDQDCVDKEKCEKYCQDRHNKSDMPKYKSDFTCDSPISEPKEMDNKCNGNKITYSQGIILNPITNIYPSLNDITKDAIFEINANKQNFLEDKLVVDFKSRMIFKMKNYDNKIINDIKTQELKTFDKLNYWNLNENYLETNVDNYKLTHDTKKLSGYTQIFVLRLSSFNNVNLVNYVDKNNKERSTNPLIIKNNKFSYADGNSIQEYKISKCRVKTSSKDLLKCGVSSKGDGIIRSFDSTWGGKAYYYVAKPCVNGPYMGLAPPNYDKMVPVCDGCHMYYSKKGIWQSYFASSWANRRYKQIIPDGYSTYSYPDDCANPEIDSYEKKPAEAINDEFYGKWIFLAVKFKKEIGDENIKNLVYDCEENVREDEEEPFKKTEIFLNSLENELETIEPILDSVISLDHEPLFYHTINKPQDSGSMNGFDLSMMFSFNKSLSDERINQIYRKIKQDNFNQNKDD